VEFPGYYLLLATSGICVLLAAILLGLYLLDTRKERKGETVADTLQKVADVPNQIIKAADNVIETGMKETFDISFTVFGRKIGVAVEVSLLSKEPER
jgi:hypothetical protein